MHGYTSFCGALLIAAALALPGHTAGRPAMPHYPAHHPNHIPKLRLNVVHEDVHLAPTEDVLVRRYHPPVEFDDKGKMKKHTAEELKALKEPHPTLVGYTAAFTDLKKGQVVLATLRVRRTASTSLAKTSKTQAGTSQAEDAEDKGEKATDKGDKADSEPSKDNKPKGTFVGKVGGVITNIDAKTRQVTVRVDAAMIEQVHKGRQQGAKTQTINLTGLDTTIFVILADSAREYETGQPSQASASRSTK